jgi:hypothetical protein
VRREGYILDAARRVLHHRNTQERSALKAQEGRTALAQDISREPTEIVSLTEEQSPAEGTSARSHAGGQRPALIRLGSVARGVLALRRDCML